MNFRRGFFRLWLLFSILFVIGTTAVFFRDVMSEFEKAALVANSILMVPVAPTMRSSMIRAKRASAGIKFRNCEHCSRNSKT